MPGRLAAVQERVARAADSSGRDASSVRLLVATKTQPASLVREVLLAGCALIGENRVQELVAKAGDLADLPHESHLIGQLQGNKVGAAVRHASCIQTLDSSALAARVARRCEDRDVPLDVMVQVNVSGEPAKSGVAPEAAAALALEVAAMAPLRLVGLMTVGLLSDHERAVRRGFARLRGIRDQVLATGEPGTASATELSMGMSGDLEWAVAEGSTIVRVGTAVFGPRPRP